MGGVDALVEGAAAVIHDGIGVIARVSFVDPILPVEGHYATRGAAKQDRKVLKSPSILRLAA